MGGSLPHFEPSEFAEGLARRSPVALPDAAQAALYRHYLDLRRWSPRLSLVGPGTAVEILDRHYGESLAALALIRANDRRLVDVGSGAGFPGVVLAAAAPLDVLLLEPRARKRAFLDAVARHAGLSCRCLDARVDRPLPEGLRRVLESTPTDVFTCRAVALSTEVLEELLKSSPRARALLWCGERSPTLPAAFAIRRELPLPGSHRRRILEIGRPGPGSTGSPPPPATGA